MKKIKIISCFLCIFLLSGCYDRADVEETAYLIGLGIDKKEDGQDCVYTFQFADPLVSYGEKEGNKDEKNPTVKNVVISAKDFYSAKNYLRNYLSKGINMSHLKLIVFSSDFAKTSIKEHINLFKKERQIRPGTYLAVAKENAEDFLKETRPEFEESTSKYYELSNSEKMLVFAPPVRLSDFINDSNTFDKSAVLPISEVHVKKEREEFLKENNKINPATDSKGQLFGMGIFKDFSLTGILSGEEARIYNLLKGKEKNFTFSIGDEKNKNQNLAFDVIMIEKPKYKIEKNKIIVELLADIRYIGMTYPKGYKTEDELNASLEKNLKNNIYSFFNKTKNELGQDVLKLERYFKTKYLDNQELKKENFGELYKNAKVEVIIKAQDSSNKETASEIN